MRLRHLGLAWSVVGDFNAMRSHEEKRNSRNEKVGERDMLEFDAFIHNMELVDISLVG